jgi:hypothetical protein
MFVCRPSWYIEAEGGERKTALHIIVEPFRGKIVGISEYLEHQKLDAVGVVA